MPSRHDNEAEGGDTSVADRRFQRVDGKDDRKLILVMLLLEVEG